MNSFRFILAPSLCLASLVLFGCSPPDPEPEIHASPSHDSPEAAALSVDPQDWPWWRGGKRNGTAPDQDVPTDFSDSKHVLWKSSIPGRGHADPTIVGDRVFLATADESKQEQSVVCLDRATGKQLWQQTIHTSGFDKTTHHKNTQASSTIASDGKFAFVAFLNNAAIWVTALDFDGNLQWQREVGVFRSKFGYSASPTIFEGLVILGADHQGGGYLAALNRADGEIRWRRNRPAESSYVSPVVVEVAGRHQLLTAGCNTVSAYDPHTGDELWSVAGTTEACVGSPVFDGEHVYASGGYPGSQTLCVKADGSGTIVWSDNRKSYVPSLLLHDGRLYSVNDKGIAVCWNAADGTRLWQHRIGEDHSASPVLIGNNIFAASEKGKVTVFEATGDEFRLVAENRLGTEIFASPVAVGNQLFLRVADSSSGTRQETLYCIGMDDPS